MNTIIHALEYFVILFLQVAYSFQMSVIGALIGGTIAALLLIYVPFAWQIAVIAHAINFGRFLTSANHRRNLRQATSMLNYVVELRNGPQ